MPAEYSSSHSGLAKNRPTTDVSGLMAATKNRLIPRQDSIHGKGSTSDCRSAGPPTDNDFTVSLLDRVVLFGIFDIKINVNYDCCIDAS